MAQTIHLEVVTPTGVAVRAEVDQVEGPSVFGEFGVLPGHLPLLAALREGVVRFRSAGKITTLAVRAGFAEAGPDKTTVLTPEAVQGNEVDVATVRSRRDELQRQLDEAASKGGAIDESVTGERDWMNAQLDAARETGKSV